MTKKILYIDMDNVLVDFPSAFAHIAPEMLEQYKGDEDEIPHIFSKMQPMNGAIDAVNQLSNHFDIYVLSTAPWGNATAWHDKVEWIQKYFGKEEDSPLYKRLILTHHKNLNSGDYLVDDRTKNGADKFEGEHILFGAEPFADWNAVSDYLMTKI